MFCTCFRDRFKLRCVQELLLILAADVYRGSLVILVISRVQRFADQSRMVNTEAVRNLLVNFIRN